MSVKAKYRDGVFLPIEKTDGLTPGRIYTVFSEDELRDGRAGGMVGPAYPEGISVPEVRMIRATG